MRQIHKDIFDILLLVAMSAVAIGTVLLILRGLSQ